MYVLLPTRTSVRSYSCKIFASPCICATLYMYDLCIFSASSYTCMYVYRCNFCCFFPNILCMYLRNFNGFFRVSLLLQVFCITVFVHLYMHILLQLFAPPCLYFVASHVVSLAVCLPGLINCVGFYRATRMHSADYPVARCPSVCPSVRHTPVLCHDYTYPDIF